MKCIHAKALYTGTSVVDDAYLLFDDREIVGVSKTRKGTLAGKFAFVTPAFIDPHSHIGMYRTAEPEAEGEGNDEMQAILALSDALDSVQMDDAAFVEAIEMGVLYSCVVPGSGNIIGGRSAVIRHYAKNTNDALFARAGVKAAFGFNPMSVAGRGWKGERPTTRMGAVAILRARLHDVADRRELRFGVLRKGVEMVFGDAAAAGQGEPYFVHFSILFFSPIPFRRHRRLQGAKNKGKR